MSPGGGVVKGSERDDTPVLITAAAPSHDDEHAARKRKYMIMMGLRIPFLLGALACYQTWWLALGLIVISIPLPWAAVLIANDRPPRKAERVNRFQQSSRQIEGGNHQIIDG
ncbi:MAG TPA: DUF3099 domain-containing protein [Actinophytocola sp.]|uniref:DUF3099 domain-containing protein n=1 Tax=Actinophytocola sp. TaxID=1872138 RepID=UPI002DDD6C8D|nr:DUF3099 domain-containing protein [Actinophytocola sp.]HEV2781853.1 DUF3099 domain-containing protein [Actinophytocola sp.]